MHRAVFSASTGLLVLFALVGLDGWRSTGQPASLFSQPPPVMSAPFFGGGSSASGAVVVGARGGSKGASAQRRQMEAENDFAPASSWQELRSEDEEPTARDAHQVPPGGPATSSKEPSVHEAASTVHPFVASRPYVGHPHGMPKEGVSAGHLVLPPHPTRGPAAPSQEVRSSFSLLLPLLPPPYSLIPIPYCPFPSLLQHFVA